MTTMPDTNSGTVAADERVDRRLVLVRRAHVAVQQPAEPAQVLDHQRTVHAELVVKIPYRARCGQRAEYGARRVTWQNLAGEEDHEAEDPERDDGKTDSPEQVPRHATSPTASGWPLQPGESS